MSSWQVMSNIDAIKIMMINKIRYYENKDIIDNYDIINNKIIFYYYTKNCQEITKK